MVISREARLEEALRSALRAAGLPASECRYMLQRLAEEYPRGGTTDPKSQPNYGPRF